jgi:uncharacterized protein (UPF0264 family)
LPDERLAPLLPSLQECLAAAAGSITPENFVSMLDDTMRRVLHLAFRQAGADDGTVWLVDEAKELRMSTALSGALRMSDLDVLTRINPDIVGVRGAVCTNGDRVGGKIDGAAVGRVKQQLELRLSGQIDVFAKQPTVLRAA